MRVPGSVRMARRKPSNRSAGAPCRRNRAFRSLPGPVRCPAPRTGEGCLTGIVEVSVGWTGSAGAEGAQAARNCSKAPAASGFRRLTSGWSGRCGNRPAQSRRILFQEAVLLRRPSTGRTGAMVRNAASVQAGAGPGLRGTDSTPALDRVVGQAMDVGEQQLSCQHGGGSCGGDGCDHCLLPREPVAGQAPGPVRRTFTSRNVCLRRLLARGGAGAPAG